jgi:hypothetical protein
MRMRRTAGRFAEDPADRDGIAPRAEIVDAAGEQGHDPFVLMIGTIVKANRTDGR